MRVCEKTSVRYGKKKATAVSSTRKEKSTFVKTKVKEGKRKIS